MRRAREALCPSRAVEPADEGGHVRMGDVRVGAEGKSAVVF
jgi:hypothetical protein